MRQSRESVLAEERRNFGDTRPAPGKLLTAEPLSAHELRVHTLRRTETREVYELGVALAQYPGTLRDAVAALVDAVDDLNCMIAGIAIPTAGDRTYDPFKPDFSGLTVDQLSAKRCNLCLAAKKALRFILVGLLHDAVRCCREALDTCFGKIVVDTDCAIV